MNARWVPVLLGIICAILLLAALYFADAIIAPVACALFIIAVVWPLQKRLSVATSKRWLPAPRQLVRKSASGKR